MSRLQRAVKDYLSLRRALGYKLEREDMLLPEFASYLEDNHSLFITTQLALDWAMLPAAATSNWWARRLSIVRRFALHLKPIDPRTEIPPQGLLIYKRQRFKPYIYSDKDILALMQACQHLRGPLKPATYKTLIGLLATTGMRVGEAISLEIDDVKFDNQLLVVRNSKFGKTREVMLHSTTLESLKNYARRRRGFAKSKSFFVSRSGTKLLSQNVWHVFNRLRPLANLPDHPQSPRIHDLRHSFAVTTLLRWYREGADVEVKLPLLSTYLGHVSPTSTYHYLSDHPELMTVAAKRLERNLGDLP